MDLLALSVSHRTAPLDLRERLAPAPDGAGDGSRALLDAPGVHEAMALSTCHRSELYLAVSGPDSEPARAAAEAMLARRAGLPREGLAGHLQVLRGAQVARHLFSVTAGLESMVLGEAEIQGQVRRAHEGARACGAAGPVLDRLVADALAAGGRVRSGTGLGRGGASVSSVAVELAREAAGPLAGRRVLVVGAGESGSLSARALAAEGMQVTVASRRHASGAGGAAPRNGAVGLQAVPAELARADVVFTAATASRRLLDRETVAAAVRARDGRPLVVVDLGVPRNVAPTVRRLRGVRLLDLDDVQRRVDANHERRSTHRQRAASLVDADVARFERWRAGLAAAPAVAALHELADGIVAGVLRENHLRWEALTAADRERVATVARTVARRLLHEPGRRLREGGEPSACAALELFGLDPGAAEVLPAAGRAPRGRYPRGW